MSIARLDSWLAILSLTCLIPIWALAVASEEPKDTLEELRDRDYSIGSITPIYQELVRFSLPARFKHAYEKDSGSFYIEEFVPNGETVDTWSQMITVTGSKGLAANESATPQRLAEQVAAGIQRACPATFAAKADRDAYYYQRHGRLLFDSVGREKHTRRSRAGTQWRRVVVEAQAAAANQTLSACARRIRPVSELRKQERLVVAQQCNLTPHCNRLKNLIR